LDWSVHFLTGQTEFYNFIDGWIPLSQNPLTNINAHGHKKNHFCGSAEIEKLLLTLNQPNRLVSLYPHPGHPKTIAKKLNIETDTMSHAQWMSMLDYAAADYNQMIQMCNANSAKIIFVSLSNHMSVYADTIRSLEGVPFGDAVPSVDNIRNSVDNVFFKDSITAWQKLGLTDVWDIRERCALKTNVLDWKPRLVDLNFEHYWIDAQNLWHNGEREIPKIIQWLGLSVDQERFNSWLAIYREWQKIQLDALQFQYNCQHIVDSIINNWWYPIDLTFDQEVIIQHFLIFDHGMNLKTWQLEKFPNNTQELHKLLEPNIHPL